MVLIRRSDALTTNCRQGSVCSKTASFASRLHFLRGRVARCCRVHTLLGWAVSTRDTNAQVPW